MMRNMFARPVQNPPITRSPTPEPPEEEEPGQPTLNDQSRLFAEQVSFHSDLSSEAEYDGNELIGDKEQPRESEVNMGAGYGEPLSCGN